jgi:hypothetical protein
MVRRAVLVRSTAKPYYRKVLANPRVATPTRLSLANSLIFSRSEYALGVLTRINAKEFRRYHAAILYVYRCILGKPKHAKIHGASDLDVVAELAAIAPVLLDLDSPGGVVLEAARCRILASTDSACCGYLSMVLAYGS